MSRRVRVHLHGPFAEFHPGPIEVVCDTAWGAIELVVNQLKGFIPDIHGRKRCQAVGFTTLERLKAAIDVDDIHIMPAMTFGKTGGIVQTIIGAVLFVVGAVLMFVPGMQGFGMNLMMMGASMMIGGIIQMLSPQPQVGTDNQIRSKYLPGGGNTVAIGTPIPLLYGMFRCSGQILSLNVDSQDMGL